LTQINENIKERERLRFIHDHYDEKIEGYIREHDKRLKIGDQENSEFMKRFQRVKNFIFIFLNSVPINLFKTILNKLIH